MGQVGTSAGRRCWGFGWVLRVLVAGGVVGAGSGEVLGDGRLEELRGEVRRGERETREAPEPSRPSQRSRGPRHRERGFFDDDEEAGLAEVILEIIFTGPFVIPALALDDDMVRRGYFPRYPYAGWDGSMFTGALPEDGQRYSLRLRGETIYESSDLYRVGGHFQLDSHFRLGLDVSAHQWRESLPEGRDRLWTGSANVLYRFAQGERVQFRSGLGVNWLHDDRSTNLGPNFTYMVDVYPGRPWVFGGRFDAGTIGRAAHVRGRVTAGAMIGRVELFVGYDYFRARGFESHGPVAGIGVSF